MYRARPELYVRDYLDVRWWSKQIEVAHSVVERQKTLVRAAHSVGKSYLAGGLVNWHFDCWVPSITLTTAPTRQGVEEVLWKEVRTQRRHGEGLLPKAARMQTTPDHFAVGYTARNAAAFQGRHDQNVLIIFDEAVGIDAPFWDAAEGMAIGPEAHWLALMNPTDTATRAYQEELTGDWNVITITALEHPNIAAELAGEEIPFPGAVRLAWLADRTRQWCTPIAANDRRSGDIEFPPGSGYWHRPGPLFEGRVLGRWPTQGSTSVWNEAMWDAALEPLPVADRPLEIGCDVARFGDDYTSIVVRRGASAIHHETHNGWNTEQTAGRLKLLARMYAAPGEPPETVAIKIDDDGVGGGVTDKAGRHRFCGVSGAGRAFADEDYPNRRSELWFAVAERADSRRLDLSRLSRESLGLLRMQLMAPKWRIDSQGRRVVEPKEETKRRVRRSPDDADALNLAFAPVRAPRVVRMY